jgi:hypothetical protein
MASTHQSQFHQMSQPTSSQHPFASDFDHDQYRDLQSMFKSNVQQQVPYSNQMIASQSSYNELAFQPSMFNQQHQQKSSCSSGEGLILIGFCKLCEFRC